MKPTGVFTATKCAAYLRHIGVNISPDEESGWQEQEREERKRRLAHKRELKKTCGHFRTYPCTAHFPGGRYYQTVCRDCGVVVSTRAA